MRINFRQGITSHQAGGFLHIAPSGVNILATNRPVTVSVAHKNTNYTHSEDRPVNNAWHGPFVEQNYWLYWDFNPLTFARTFGHTTIEPVAQSVKPGSGNSPVAGAIPGDVGIGAFLVDGYYNLPIGKPLTIINSVHNNGIYTVRSISYSTTTGKTTIGVDEPVVSNVADGEITLDIDSHGNPLAITGRHWYNTTTNEHFVLSGVVWQPVLRVFAAQLINGNTFISLSQNSQSGIFTGTQIGNNQDASSGRVLSDESGSAIRRADGTFFTTEDQFSANQSRVDALRLESNVTRAQCIVSSLAKFSVVAWKGDGKIAAASYDDVGSTVVGVLVEGLSNLEVGAVILQGTVTNPLWNWTGGSTPTLVGSPLWVLNGELVTVDPHVSDIVTYRIRRVPVARVLDKDTIIFEQGLGGIGDQGPAGNIENIDPADTTNLGGCTLVTASSDPTRAFVISDTDSRLSNARPPLSHTHSAIDVTFQPAGGVIASDVQAAINELGLKKLNITGGSITGTLSLNSAPTAQLHAANKQYVDNLVAGLNWLEPIGGVNMISDNVTVPPLNPTSGDSYIIPSGASGDWASVPVGNHVHWQIAGSPSGEWVDHGPIGDINLGHVRLGVAMRSAAIPSGTFAGQKNNIAIFNEFGVVTGFEIPSDNNAVYVESGHSEYAFDQYAFDGTKWVRFGGSNQPIIGDGTTITVSGGTISVIPSTSGGQSDAATLGGHDFTALDLRWSPFSHTHAATSLSVTPYVGDATWGTPTDTTTGQLTSTTVSTALIELVDTKAEKTPLYATTAALPSAITEKGMLATVDDMNAVYFADDGGWSALARADHEHVIPYDMAFYVHGALISSQNIGIFAVTRNVYVPANAAGSIGLVGIPASSLPTTLSIRKGVAPYTSSVEVGTVAFSPGSYTGTITWPLGVLFEAGNMLILATSSSVSDLEQLSVTIVGCSIAQTCALPPAPTVTFITNNPLDDGDPITNVTGGSVDVTGTITSILWTQLEYSTDGITYVTPPGTNGLGDLTFSNPTIQIPSVFEAGGSGSGLYYKVRITVTGPGGTAVDEQIINFNAI